MRLFLAAAMMAVVWFQSASSQTPLTLVATIVLPGVEGRIDHLAVDTGAQRLYVGFGSGALAAVNPADAKVVGQAKLAGHPESFQLERSGSRIFLNVPTADQIAVVDRNAMKVVATWPVVTAKSNFPM